MRILVILSSIFMLLTPLYSAQIDDIYIKMYSDQFEIREDNVSPYLFSNRCPCTFKKGAPFCKGQIYFKKDATQKEIVQAIETGLFTVHVKTVEYDLRHRKEDRKFKVWCKFQLSDLYKIAEIESIDKIFHDNTSYVSVPIDGSKPRKITPIFFGELEIPCDSLDSIYIYDLYTDNLIRTIVCPRRWNGTNQERYLITPGDYCIVTADSTFEAKVYRWEIKHKKYEIYRKR